MTRKEEIRGMAIQLQSAVKDKRRRWLPIKDFKTLLSFILELTAPESSPKEKKVGGMATVYPLENEVVSLTKPEGWIDGVGVQSSTAERFGR